MSAQEVLNPLGSPEGKLIQNTWMDIYREVLAGLIPFLTEQFPRSAEQDEKTYAKAIKAKAFDIARSLLPAGATTLLSWHTNLRQAYDHLQRLNHHPLEEIREVSREVLNKLIEKYPSSFGYKRYPEQEAYIGIAEEELAYYDRSSAGGFRAISMLDVNQLMELRYKKFLETRPIKTELPHQFRKFGNIRFKFPLDFGSFRDIQRHRSGVMPMPLLTTYHGFFPWYVSQLPKDLVTKVGEIVIEQQERIMRLDCSQEVRQYYIAMGYTVACELTASLPAAIYIAELRSGQTVHPTLRVVAQQMGEAIKDLVPGIAMHCDMSPDAWDIKRGKQDIVKK
jgi:thymidylate synthase ThyX